MDARDEYIERLHRQLDKAIEALGDQDSESITCPGDVMLSEFCPGQTKLCSECWREALEAVE